LALDFLRNARTRSRPVEGFTPEALYALTTYDWPGNVRELAGVVERAVQLAEGMDKEDFKARPEARRRARDST
jgi:DNA-binding NtrC family response regulator